MSFILHSNICRFLPNSKSCVCSDLKWTRKTSDETLTGKAIATTRGASGIRRATAKILASHSAKVSIAGLSADALEVVANEIKEPGGEVHVKATSVRRRDAVETWIKKSVKILVNLTMPPI
jgi:NADP-dependent 3-hydroxy acid dehydrogenase YdfG